MRNETVTVSITLEIQDPEAFRAAAFERAKADGLTDGDAYRYKDEEQTSLGECAQMLLDPGTGPEGSSILGSESD